MFIIPLIAAIISFIFGIGLVKQYRLKKQPFQTWWASAMFLYSFATLMEAYANLFAFGTISYKLYYFAAVSLVAVMASGQMYLFSKSAGRWFGIGTLLIMLLFAILLVGAPTDVSVFAQQDITVAGTALGSPVRPWFPILLSAIPGVIMIVGPLLSWWKSRKKAPLYIAAGALVLSMAGESAKLGFPDLLIVSELIGISIMYFGFTRTPTPTSTLESVTLTA